MAAARNIAIVALLALALDVLPGGGNLATAILTALTLIMFAAFALLAGRMWQESSITRDVMTDKQRTRFYAGLGGVALMIVGTDELFATGAGTIAWLAIMGASAYLIIDSWRQASSY